jgi:hypothetical protein
MDTYPQMRNTLKTILATAGLALLLGAIPVSAQTIVGLGPSLSGSVTIVFNGTGYPIDVTLPSVLSGTGYVFDSGGTATVFSPGSTDLTPFSSSDQGTTLSLSGGTPTLVTWVDIGGGGLPGILVLQFTTSDQYPGTDDDLVLDLISASQPYIGAVPPSLEGGGSSYEPSSVSNICDPSIGFGCNYDDFVTGSGTIVTSYSFCNVTDTEVCPNGTLPNPITATADVSSGEVHLDASLPTPEPSCLSLFAIGLISIFGSAVVRRKLFHA